MPFLALALLELGLRLAGCGYVTSFFVPHVVGGRAMLVENWRFGWRFFHPEVSRSPPPSVMPASKPPGVFRIFLYGESAALGDPRPAYGAGRYLETLLRERFPGTEFEVVCVAMTAINSHVIVPIARECAREQGDLWIVYMGNNEYIGPFGPSTVFGPSAISTRAARAYTALQTTRTGQMLVALGRRLSGHDRAREGWGGLGMFLANRIPPGDARRQEVSGNFRRNLEEIIGAGRRAGVPVLLSSMASNLRDCAPFGSMHQPGLSPPQLANWNTLCQTSSMKAETGHWAEAAELYQKALKISPAYAEVQFRLGACWLELANDDAAAKCYTLARDLDALPFRADSALNAAAAEAARRHQKEGVYFVDSEKALARLGRGQLPGQESFYEHVHLNFDGNYQLARTWAEAIVPLLPARITQGQREAWAEPQVCAQRLGLSAWNRYRVLEEVRARLLEAPYTNQVSHPAQFKRVEQQLEMVKQQLQAQDRQEARTELENAIQRRPQDHWLHQNLAEFLEAVGDLAQATAQWQRVSELLPHHHVGHFQSGRLLTRLGKYEEAKASLETALRVRPDLAEARIELGKMCAAQHRWPEALEQYDQAQRIRPDDPRSHLLRAEVLGAQGDHAGALASVRRAMELRQSYWEAHFLRGLVLAADDKASEAEAEFEEVIRLRPGHAPAYFNLGVVLAKQNRTAEAMAAFQETLRRDPAYTQAAEHLDALQRSAQAPP